MDTRSGMTPIAVKVGPEHTLAQAAARMVAHNVGSAVVIDPEAPTPGIITERDVLRAVAAGLDPGREVVRNHLTADVTVCELNTALEVVADTMIRGGFRHMLVADRDDLVGMVSMRDIVRCWVGQRTLMTT